MPPASLSNQWGPNLLTESERSCCQGLFSVSPFTFFSLYLSSRANSHPVLTLKGDRSLLEERGGREVMSSLPLGGISLIKMKSSSPEWQSYGGAGGKEARRRAQRVCVVWGPDPGGSEAPLPLCSPSLQSSLSPLAFSLHLLSPFLSSSLSSSTAVQNRRICQRCVKRSALSLSDELPSTGAGL